MAAASAAAQSLALRAKRGIESGIAAKS